MRYILCFLILNFLTNLSGYSYNTDIDFNPEIQKIFSNSGEKENISDKDIIYLLQKDSLTFEKVKKGKVIYNCFITLTEQEQKNLGLTDNKVMLPFIVYVPEKYDYSKRTPLIVYLHGGISRETPEDVEMWDISENCYYDELNNRGWLGLFPTGKVGFTWWDDANIKAICEIIKDVKLKYNVDDNRVYLSGISDGGSGAFCFAALCPTPFASFYPIIGSVGVHSGSRGEAFAPGNLSSRFIYAVNNDMDPLYPSEYMKAINKILFDNKVDIFYKEYYGFGHEFPYANQEIPLIANYMDFHPRNPFPAKIYWETYDTSFGRCDWLEISGIDSLMAKKEWQKTFSHRCQTKRVIFGFVPDGEINKNGCRIKSVSEGSISEKMGLLPGDTIIKIDNIEMIHEDSLWVAKEQLEINKELVFTIIRQNQLIDLQYLFDKYLEYEAFPYNSSAGAVKAKFFDNTFYIYTSGVGKIAVYISEEMVNMQNPVQVYINEQLCFDDNVVSDYNFALKEFRFSSDRKAIWVNKLEFQVKE